MRICEKKFGTLSTESGPTETKIVKFRPKKAYSKRALDEHINGVHLNIKPHACDFCEFNTAYRSILNEHKRVAHGTQKYDCLYCEHSARYKGNLDKHIQNVHQKLKLS